MRVLVTGHRGYIGSVLTSVLKAARFEVVGLDAGFFEPCGFGRMVGDEVPSLTADVRELDYADLLPYDAVIHLAALSDDATCDVEPGLTEEINVEATARLAACCREARVSRFILASTCAVYGRTNAMEVDEITPPSPVTTYAQSKLQAEAAVSAFACDTFTPIILRFGTVYGVSPRLRLDTVVNDFTASAVTTGCVTMKTSGHEWRPLVHVEDLSRVIAAMVTAPTPVVQNQVYNVVEADGNYRVIEIADAVEDNLPGCRRGLSIDEISPRSYRVGHTRLMGALPGFEFRWTLERGIRQLVGAMQSNGLTSADWRGTRFRRAAGLQARLNSGAFVPCDPVAVVSQ